MTSLLESPTVRQQVHRISVADYHRLGEIGLLGRDVELLRGLIVHKMAKSPLHEFVAQKLMNLLLLLLPRDFQLRREGPLTLRDSEPEPDLSVVRGRPEDWLNAHPSSAELVIEVSITSAEVDESKANLYAEAGIPEYWIVRPDRRMVDVYRDATREGYRSKTTVTAAETLSSTSIPSLNFRAGEIFPDA